MATSKQIANSFRSSIKNGTPTWQAIQAVAKRWKVTPNRVATVVTKEKFCVSKPFNGHKVFWPTFTPEKKSQKWNKECEYFFMQWAIDWAFINGWAKPEDFKGWTPRQIWFFLAPKFNAHFKPYKRTAKPKTRKRTTTSRKRKPTTRTKSRTTTSRKRKPTTKAKRRTTTTSRKRKSTGLKYKGRTFKSKGRKTTTRRYRKAA